MEIHSGFVTSGVASIYYEETGTGRPVLFCHAGVTDRRLWEHQFANPVPGHRYVRSDMRGFGKSEWAAEKYSPTDDLLNVIDALGLDDLVLVGCSMGGRASLEIAVRRPDQVSGLIIVGAGLPGWQPDGGGYTPPQWAELDPLWEAKDWTGLATIDADVWLVGVGRERTDVDPDLHRFVVEMGLTPVSTELERDDYFSWSLENEGGHWGKVDVPSLVMVGEHDLPDLVTSTRLLAELISSHPRELLTGTAHLPSLERPDLFNPLLEDFLRSLSSA